ncbi:thioredoxin domain-containing protein [Citricoccus sp. NPDC055426]|uniref:DsbA family protein n=1 Tax=Citricoccus sp. NPDC055426 TaxID=3155536 RepID=UPI003444989D
MRTDPSRLGACLTLAAVATLTLTGCAEAIRSSGSGSGADSAATTAREVQIFEDFACPHCAAFHDHYGGMVHGLVSGGAAEVDYRIVDFLGRGDPESWSTRAATSYYCMEEALGDSDAATGTLHGFQTWLFEQAPAQPDDEALVAQAGEMAPDAGTADQIGQCITADGTAGRIESAMSDFTDFGLRGVPSVYSPAEGTLYNPEEHGDLKVWLTGSGAR